MKQIFVNVNILREDEILLFLETFVCSIDT